ncbi:putative glycosidase CRH2, partial [Dispira parvispora]
MHFFKQTRTYGALSLLYTLVSLSSLQKSAWALPQAPTAPTAVNANSATSCARKEWTNFNDPAFHSSFDIQCGDKNVIIDANGMLTLKADKDCYWPGFSYKFDDLHYGTATVELTMAGVSGWATAFIRGEEGGDEIDMEWVGKTTNVVETMIFKDGKSMPGHDEADKIHSGESMAEVFHRYDIVFLPDRIEFKVNGKVGSTYKRSDLPKYPDGAKKLKLNLWDGGRDHSSWAGKTEWNNEIFAQIRYLAFTPYCDGV